MHRYRTSVAAAGSAAGSAEMVVAPLVQESL